MGDIILNLIINYGFKSLKNSCVENLIRLKLN